MSSLELQNLRRIVGAVARLRGASVRHLTVRSDARQVKVDAAAPQQIEVRFD